MSVPSAPTSDAPSASPAPSADDDADVQMQAPKDAASLGWCTKDEQQAALDETKEIAKLVSKLPKDASAADAVTGRIAGLFNSPCYMDGTLARSPDMAELEAARAWAVAKWWDSGGQDFFKDALQHANAVHFAPSIPRMIAPELLPTSDPMRAILCPSFSAVCDPVAEGTALDVGRELVRVGLLQERAHREDSADDGLGSPEACARSIRKEPPAERLARYTACVDKLVSQLPALPEARYRSPQGWLVLRGRRGHYSFCDEARAYDLETGTAYIASRCGGLVLDAGGAVNQGATRGTGAMKTQVGTLSVDALRRLALALWLKDKLDKDARPYAAFPLPAGVPMPDPDRSFGFGFGSGWGHSGQTSIQFEINDGKSTVVSGTFVWPDAFSVGDQLADDLVVSAETTFREGCPRVALPAGLSPARTLGGVSGIDASPDTLRKNADDLSAAFAELRKTKVCKK
ncbi:hypothetical protein [Polyangium sp. y55x31]|uniref:hypothetical protein n=1 Tax=Polyangium sp. y55x31 TaxID=3042688 RepID=UPI0024824CE8|nr:hypothetical protein [Polyangium sp. y55x31]MDI1480103.1 hypothetical protein [Polyangium sp. y55x31]